MTILELPVSSFSKKILLAEYQLEPIALQSTDPLFQSLCYRAPRSRHNLKKLQYYLKDTIQICINTKLANHIRPNAYQIGHHLWTLHIHQMLGWVYCSTLLGENARKSLERFYAFHDIEEDDFAFDSAYKRWQRYKAKKSVKLSADRGIYQAARIPPNCPVIKVRIPPTADQLEDFICTFVLSMPAPFHKQDGNFSAYSYYQLRAFVFNKIGQVAVKDLAEAWRWLPRTTYKRITRFAQLLDQDAQLQQHFQTHTEYTFGPID